MISLDRLSTTSAALSATSSKKAKVALLAQVLRDCAATELPVVIAALTGEPRQGRIGVGWSTVYDRGHVAAPGSTRVLDNPSPSVLEFDLFVDEVAALGGPGSNTARQVLVDSFLARCTADTAAFVRNLFTGGIRQGALHGLMIEAVAEALQIPSARLRRALTFNGDLAELAAMVVEQGPTALDTVTIQVGRPMAPMLAATAGSVAEALADLGRVSIEWKLDGARIQVHVQRDTSSVAAETTQPATVTLFTRNLNDVTVRLPEVCAVMSALPVQSLVADGEVLGVDDDGKPAAFQDTMARVGSDEDGPQHQVRLRPFLFDLLHVDGVDLVDRPLHERRQLLLEIAPHLAVPGCMTDSLEEALAIQQDALSRGHEGVMVKAAASTYDAGRRGSAWRKVKPVRTLDLVVLGAEWGHGRRTGWLSNLHLGARDDRPGCSPDSFVMVGKTFKGLTDTMLAEQTAALLEREVRRAGITVFVRPELVVEIALDGIQRSSRYPGGVALRFARVKGYRPDRAASTADTISAVWALGSPSGDEPSEEPEPNSQD
jgi:DNA ligase 1